MCVPGAMAATSAAIVIRKPADAAREPDGPTNTTTGVRALRMAELMSRVESTRPPGVRRVMTIAAAPGRVGLRQGAAEILRGDRVDDAVNLGEVDDGRRRSARRRRDLQARLRLARRRPDLQVGAVAAATTANARIAAASDVPAVRMRHLLNRGCRSRRHSRITSLLDLREHPLRVGGGGIHGQRPLRFRACPLAVAGLQVCLRQRHVRRGAVRAPDRDLQGVDRVARGGPTGGRSGRSAGAPGLRRARGRPPAAARPALHRPARDRTGGGRARGGTRPAPAGPAERSCRR